MGLDVTGAGSSSHLPSVVTLPGFTLHIGRHEPGSLLPRHEHDQPTICYVMRGRFTEYSGGRAVDCAGGTLKLMPAGEAHWNRFAQTATRGVRIDVDAARFAGSPGIMRALDERLHFEGGRGTELARRLLRALREVDDVARLTAEGLALELLGELARESLPRSVRGTPGWLALAVELIRARFTERLTLSEIARQVGVRPATLARAFRAEFDSSVGERIRALRVEAAASALRRTRLPLTEIALQSGFYDQSHLTNVFRRLRGVTPAEYRRLAG